MSVIYKPLITEKQTAATEKLNQYGFLVDTKANKVEIKKAVEAMYKVKVDSVNTMKYKGKAKSRYTKRGFFSGRTNAVKKAVVSLAPGEAIDFYSNL
ncbi:MAG: 50S ribosomal protein L23 [Flavobacteriales bacterium]|nr:50S ribosomal protein L23 [Flavobacteriales bacterium]MCB9447065.1 50S ribosomal protein L23 [Flavobacteriales bacterium]